MNTTIPNSVTSISRDAFYGCTNLKRITLPSTLEGIGEYAFRGCDAIETIYSNISWVFALPTDKTIFDQIVYDNAVLYVPAGTKNKYKQIQGWKKFLNVEEYPVKVIT